MQEPAIAADGNCFPLGATVKEDGVQFSVFSQHATSVQLLLFDHGQSQASRVIDLDPLKNRISDYWHIHIPDIVSGQIYGFKVDGPCDPERGYRFDSQKLLLDPYTCAIDSSTYDRSAAIGSGANDAVAMKSVVVDLSLYDWQGDKPLRLPFANTIIYEIHVGGFTSHPNSGVAVQKRGTYAGLIEKIPYLQNLGVSAVELMPVFQFDWQDAPGGLQNYWGYSPVSFFALHDRYSSERGALACLDEFRDMVKALHRAGIEVILDVVYNHTAEGNEKGPTLCFRGLDNQIYYILSDDARSYADYSGTGNTVNSNQSIVRRMIGDSLRYWVSEMHIDGFRFDLASVLNRDLHGKPVPDAPVLWDIDTDPVLAGTKLIAEAWDAAGLYQVGSFGGNHWKEWNGQFRDDVRKFLKADNDTVANLRQRLLGSPDLYSKRHLPPAESINFVTCHDGFTLNDVFSYEKRHNEDNGEDGRDGSAANFSWNCGVEGPSLDPNIEALRERQIRNAAALSLLAVGTPMLLMGDEVRRTQRGNNNSYSQDNEISWFDWDLCERHKHLHRFVRLMIELRRNFTASRGRRMQSLSQLLARARIDWHGIHLNAPDLSHDSHSIAATAHLEDGGAIQIILNAFWEPLTFALPQPPSNDATWHRIVDTSLLPPEDIVLNEKRFIDGSVYRLQSRSLALLATRLK